MNSDKSCEICNDNKSRYKCPKCLIRYCSVGCYKSHQASETCLTKAVNESTDSKVETISRPCVTIDEEGLTNDVVPQHMLDRLGDSAVIGSMIQNSHLVRVLLHVDSNNEPEEAIKQAMKTRIFEEFADECLRIVEPQPDSENISPNSA